MTLVATYPPKFSAAYFPMILRLDSDVRDDFTTGSNKSISSVTNNLGFAQLQFSGAHSLLQGDYLLITSAPSRLNLLGVSLVKKIINGNTIVINKPFTGPISSSGISFKYINNYNAVVRVYVNTQTQDDNLVAIRTIKPRFEGGFCVFECDLSSILQGYSYEGNDVRDVLDKDLYPADSNPFPQYNNRSYAEYYTEHAEAFDNPVGGDPVYNPQEFS